MQECVFHTGGDHVPLNSLTPFKELQGLRPEAQKTILNAYLSQEIMANEITTKVCSPLKHISTLL